MTEKEKMINGELYVLDNELQKDKKIANQTMDKFNKLAHKNEKRAIKCLRSLFKKLGNNVHIEPNLRVDYGYNISIGDDFYSNFDLIMLDVCDIEVGNNVFCGPRVNIFTATHPLDYQRRNKNLEYGKKVKIGNNVWIGGNATINPGVTIGDNTVIGSGSVVTKDIPSNVLACGNPCKVIRNLSEK